jgi:RNA polymerase sigma factor (sigma-70 family)
MDKAKSFWDKKYRDNASKLIGVCRRYVQERELAEDLVQEAFITAINKHHTYLGKGSFEGWLRQIVINTALMHLRKEKTNKENGRFQDEDSHELFEEPETEDTKSIFPKAEFSDEVLFAAIDSLPLHHKMVFNLYVIDNYSHKQIAAELKISEGTSKSHLSRARKKLQEILQDQAKGKKSKMLGIAVLFATLAKAGSIDKIFKLSLKNAELKPLKYPNLNTHQINWSNQVVPGILKKQVLSIVSKLVKFVFIPAATIGIIVIVNNKPEKNVGKGQKIEMKYGKEKIDSIKPQEILADTTIDVPKHYSQPDFEDTNTNKPVVVKKKIIQKQTIKVTNTIQIYDSTSTP